MNITRLFQRVASLPGLAWLSSRGTNQSTTEDLTFVPQRNQILGTQVEITTTSSGIVLPDQQGMKASIFVLIESVGPEVTVRAPGAQRSPKSMYANPEPPRRGRQQRP